MKTETLFHVTNMLQKPVIIVHKRISKPAAKSTYKSDLRNHRFSLIENRQIGNPVNWDNAWFGNYE